MRSKYVIIGVMFSLLIVIVLNISCFQKLSLDNLSSDNYGDVYYGDGAELVLYTKSLFKNSDIPLLVGEFEFIKYYGEFYGYKANGYIWFVRNDMLYVKSKQSCDDLVYVDVNDCVECNDSFFRVRLLLDNCLGLFHINLKKISNIPKIKIYDCEILINLNSVCFMDTVIELTQHCDKVNVAFERLSPNKDTVVRSIMINDSFVGPSKSIFIRANIEKLRFFRYYYELTGTIFVGKNSIRLCSWDCLRDSVKCFNLYKRK